MPTRPRSLARCPGARRAPLGVALAFAVVFLGALGAAPARAQGRYQSAFLGGRSALMGGTGVVLGVDGAAPFLNPATIIRIEDRNIAFSSRFFRYAHRTLHAWHQPGPVDPARYGDLQLDGATVSDHGLRTFPDSTCYFFDLRRGAREGGAERTPVGRQALAACLGKTEENEFGFDALAFSGESAGRRVNQAQTLRYEWGRFSAGPSWSYSATDRLAVGASLSVVRTRFASSLAVSSIVDDTATRSASSATFQSALSGDSWDLLAHLGVTYRLTEVFSAGLSVRTPSLHVFDSLDASYHDTLAGETASVRQWAAEGEFVAPSPVRLAVGASAEWSRVRLELDGFLYVGQRELARVVVDREEVAIGVGATPQRTKSRLRITEEAAPVVNVALGAEVFLTRDLSLIGGVVSDFNPLARLRGPMSAESRLFLERMSGMHAGLGMVSYTRYGDLVFGARFDYAAGQMAAVNAFSSPLQLDPVDSREFGATLVLAGRISLRSVETTARELGDAVEGSAASPAERRTPREPMKAPAQED
ncbi:hypothetical protein SOCE26_036340 [Sorangium cellulosum]|uniref:Uncharacterized protein n=1 Tax=Sorangium cellulosum TaxID=56 RepID=A0A2L0ESB9_SORCE|nr:hypothetical protein [Sorangium cellulosum]AUX42207.1 hypothetical protein SOCE26_036340 [Sorangium cellulosum]